MNRHTLRDLATDTLGYEPTEDELDRFGKLGVADFDESVHLLRAARDACVRAAARWALVELMVPGETTREALDDRTEVRPAYEAAQAATIAADRAVATMRDWYVARGLRPVRIVVSDDD